MSADRAPHLVVVSAGTSVPSSTRLLADRLATATTDALTRTGATARVTTIEVRDLAHDVVDATLTGFPSTALAAARAALRDADGVVMATPTYNLAYSGLFKSFVDVLEEGTLAGVPVLLGATGGTARHSLSVDYALRPLMGYLKAEVVPTTVFAASEDFGASTTAADADALGGRVDRAGGELAARMLGGAAAPPAATTAGTTDGGRAADTRPSGRREAPDEFDDFVPMSDLLRNPR